MLNLEGIENIQRLKAYDKKDAQEYFLLLSEIARKESQMYAIPLRHDGKMFRPMRQAFLNASVYKDVYITQIEDSGAVLFFSDAGFSCLLHYCDFADICEFIDTVKGDINYDEDEDNGNINAIMNAWYDKEAVSW